MLVVLPLMFLLVGCSTDPVLMRHVVTGKTVTCGPYPKTLAVDRLVVNERERGCIVDFQRQGYERAVN